MCDDEGRVIVHRALGVVGGQWWFQGDANRSPDLPVEPDRLIGRVVEVDVGGRRRPLGPWRRVVARARLDLAATSKRVRRGFRTAPRTGA